MNGNMYKLTIEQIDKKLYEMCYNTFGDGAKNKGSIIYEKGDWTPHVKQYWKEKEILTELKCLLIRQHKINRILYRLRNKED